MGKLSETALRHLMCGHKSFMKRDSRYLAAVIRVVVEIVASFINVLTLLINPYPANVDNMASSYQC